MQVRIPRKDFPLLRLAWHFGRAGWHESFAATWITLMSDRVGRSQELHRETGGRVYIVEKFYALNRAIAEFPGVLIASVRGRAFGLGVGLHWNSWLRTDFTAEYRGETGFHGFDTWFDGVNARFNNYTAKKSEWLFLANAYLDLGTWWRVTPFVGAGVGMASVTIHSFRDAGTTGGAGSPTMGFADAASTWNFAWAAHAGIAYRVTKNFTVELEQSRRDTRRLSRARRRLYDDIASPAELLHYGGEHLVDGQRLRHQLTSSVPRAHPRFRYNPLQAASTVT